MVVILAVLNLKKRKDGIVLPKYDPEVKVGVRDFQREAFVQANYFLSPRQRPILKQTEVIYRKPFQVQSPV
jgi:hypothetical protein